MSETINLSEATFDEEIGSSDLPVLVDFWASWCQPCKQLAPILDELASEYAGRIRVAKVDTDANLELARRFDVMTLPTMIVFKDGQPEFKIVGAKGKAQLTDALADYL